MSRGPGHIQKMVLDLIAAEPHGAWTVTDLCRRAYNVYSVDKKHRVAMLRSLRKMKLPGTWCTYPFNRRGTEYCLHDPCNLESALCFEAIENYCESADRYRERFPHMIKHVEKRVAEAQKYRDADEIGKLAMDIESQQRDLDMRRRMGTPMKQLEPLMTAITKMQERLAAMRADRKDAAPNGSAS